MDFDMGQPERRPRGSHTAAIARGQRTIYGYQWVTYCVQCSDREGEWVTVGECDRIAPADVPHVLIKAPAPRNAPRQDSLTDPATGAHSSP